MTTVLTVTTLWPLEAPPQSPEGDERLVHFIASVALPFNLTQTGRFGLIPVHIGASTFCDLIELIQPSFYHSADVSDWVADTVDVLIRIGLCLVFRRVSLHQA